MKMAWRKRHDSGASVGPGIGADGYRHACSFRYRDRWVHLFFSPRQFSATQYRCPARCLGDPVLPAAGRAAIHFHRPLDECQWYYSTLDTSLDVTGGLDERWFGAGQHIAQHADGGSLGLGGSRCRDAVARAGAQHDQAGLQPRIYRRGALYRGIDYCDHPAKHRLDSLWLSWRGVDRPAVHRWCGARLFADAYPDGRDVLRCQTEGLYTGT